MPNLDLRTLGVTLLLVSGCSSDTHVHVLDPEDHAATDAGRPPRDAGLGDAGADGLILRYDFSGTGMTAFDRVAEGNGQLVGGAMLDGQGGVELDGQDDFVDMPNGIVSPLDSATFMAWLRWEGGTCWQRVFDFGSNNRGENASGSSATSLFLTASACPDNNLTASFEIGASANRVVGSVAGSAALPDGRSTQVALVIDRARGSSTLYVDGTRVAMTASAFDLHALDDENNWLGRSQWIQDGYLHGRYEEFRIYHGALSASEIAAAATRGADMP